MRWFSRKPKPQAKPYEDYWTLHPEKYEEFKRKYKEQYGIEYESMLDEIKPH